MRSGGRHAALLASRVHNQSETHTNSSLLPAATSSPGEVRSGAKDRRACVHLNPLKLQNSGT